MRKMILTVAAVAAVTASARAQALTAPAWQAYTIISTADATAVNPVTYQWYRDNALIQGATSASYTVPGPLAYGDNVQFYRLAKTVDCTGDIEKKSNTVTITFTGYIVPEGCTLIIDRLCWASANIDNLQTFAARPDMYTKFYQWNRLTAYSANDPLTPEWNATVDTSSTWKVNPCPNGWRLPTMNECQHLDNSGNIWVDANARGNQLPGRFYGPNYTTCSLPNNMTGCIFIPASGSRDFGVGSVGYRGTVSNNASGFVWSSTQADNSTLGYYLYLTAAQSDPKHTYGGKAFGLSIRCVK